MKPTKPINSPAPQRLTTIAAHLASKKTKLPLELAL